MDRISPPEAQALLTQGWTYLDVRSEAEFEQGHPAGALNVPVMAQGGPGGMSFNPDFLPVVKAVFATDAKLVVGCLAGGRSMRAAQLLEQNGYTQVKDQRAGFGGTKNDKGEAEPGWSACGLPVENGQPGDRAYAALKAKVR